MTDAGGGGSESAPGRAIVVATPPAEAPTRPARGLREALPAPARPVPKRGPPPPDRPAARAARLSSSAQEEPLAAGDERRDRLWLGLAAVLRLAAVGWLAGGLLVWARLIGVVPAPLALSWHAPEGPLLPTVAAALVCPVVAVGLWLLSRWGVVVWVTAVALDAAAAFLMPGASPFEWPGVAANGAALGLAGALGAARAWRDRETAES